MRTVKELRDAVTEGLRWVEKQPRVKEAEVYASATYLNVQRICYATNVPSNGLEEPKSEESYGLSVRVRVEDGRLGFGKEDSALDRRGYGNAFLKAERNAVLDTDFHSLPSPLPASLRGKARAPRNAVADKAIANLDDGKAIDKAYDCLGGAFEALARAERDLNITGELNFTVERMALANSNGVKAEEENTQALAALTTLLEGKPDIAGMDFDSNTHLKALNARKTGFSSAEKALAMRGAKSIESGSYRAVLGRLAVTDLLHSRFEVGLNAVDEQATPFVGKLGRKLFSTQLNLSDDALVSGAIGSRGYTDEGFAAGKTLLVKDGVLENFLSNDYYCKKFPDEKRYNPLNGYRRGRNYASDPGIHGTNLVVEPGSFSDEELIREVRNGIYIGRIWYTYPVNGLASSDFTTTIRGASCLIEDGEIKSALTPNTCRVSDNFERVFKGVLGLGRKQRVTFAWGQEPVVITPETAVESVKVERIAKGLY